ncbi:MAG TPA: hypothetical protein VFH77_18345, partial [Streptomyces sp.]|nr:hypothetical protein [Streptomyces sp.]
MTRPARDLPDHGTLSRHKHYGCNCQRCRDNYRAYENRRSRLIGYGTWRPLVDVRPVREHVAALVASGYTIQTVADAAGIDRTVVSRVLYY